MLANTRVDMWSEDGQTFIRRFVLKIPIPTTAYTENHDYNFGQWVNDAATAASFMNVLTCPYDGAIYFNGTNFTQRAAASMADLEAFGFQVPVDLEILANGHAFRLVFYNGNYIKFHGPESSGTRWQLRYCMGNNDAEVASVDFPNDNVCTLPFPFIDANFNCIDGQLRYATTWMPSGQMYGCYVKIKTGVDLTQWFTGIEPYNPDDPYANIPNSEPSGPAEGVGIPETAGIDIPAMPLDDITEAGFITLFKPSLAQIKDLAAYMWSGLFDIDTLYKLFADPMDCILGLNIVPVSVPSGSNVTVKVGNLSIGMAFPIVTSQWVELNCGTIDIDLPYGNYLDYAPYSKASLYLPYIGTVDISIDDIMGRTLSLVYHIDVLSCACVAYLKCGPDVLYQFAGSCGYSIPITADSYKQLITNSIGIAATIGSAVVSGGATAPIVTGNLTAKQAAKAAAKAAAQQQTQTLNAISAAESSANAIMSSKPEIHRSGAIGSTAGVMGVQTPYLILELPNACKPENQYHYLGYPGFITVTVGDLSGYAEFDSIILDGIPCTEDERDQIAALCAGGIYL